MADTHNKFELLGSPSIKRKYDKMENEDCADLTPLRKKIQQDFDNIQMGVIKSVEGAEEDDTYTEIEDDIKFIRKSILVLNTNFNTLNNNVLEIKNTMEASTQGLATEIKEVK